MATKNDFKQLAKGLLNNTFKDFLKPVTFSNGSYDYDYDSQGYIAGESITTKGVRLSYKSGEFQNQAIQTGDVKILVENSFSLTIRTDDTKMNFDGVEMDIVAIDLDPADAVYTIQARPKWARLTTA